MYGDRLIHEIAENKGGGTDDLNRYWVEIKQNIEKAAGETLGGRTINVNLKT